MSQVTFRGAYIRGFGFDNAEKAPSVWVDMTADWSKKTAEDMRWGEPVEGHGNTDLVGELAATTLTLTPNGGLEMHAIEVKASSVDNFKLIFSHDKGGEVTGKEIRFTITSGDITACKTLEAYCRTLKRASAVLKVSYDKDLEAKDEQPNLVDDEGKPVLVGQAAEKHKRLREK